MKFWDSSAIVPLLVEEKATRYFSAVYARDAAMIVWWATSTECIAALARREREASERGKRLVLEAFARLDELGRHWNELVPVADVRATARRASRFSSFIALSSTTSINRRAYAVAGRGGSG